VTDAGGRVVYLITCGSPPARDVGRAVALAQSDGWTACVVTSPAGRGFLDVRAVARQTGYPVRSGFKQPDEPDLLPAADAMLVAPATVNTVVKWAAGIADTLPLGLLVEAIGRRIPRVAVPFTNDAMAAHPAFGHSVRLLRSWGVEVLYGPDVLPGFGPGRGDSMVAAFPWERAWAALRTRGAAGDGPACPAPGDRP
jgi:hypothetical protein